MRILFITRKFPPSIGGMQKVSWHLHLELSRNNDVPLVAWGGSQAALPLVLPFFFLKSCLLLATKPIDAIYLGDLLLAPLGYALGRIFGKPVAATAHGRDAAYDNPLYGAFVHPAARRLGAVVCVSRHIEKLCNSIGIKNTAVIHNGIEMPPRAKGTGAEMRRKFGINNGQILLLTVGRLVKKKGVAWFSLHVMPHLPKRFVYVIAGEGPERHEVEKIAAESGGRVVFAGAVSDGEKGALYHAADIFVMPNMRIKGEAEGFGVVALEAASHGLPTVASDIEGLRDSVNPSFGKLIPERDAAGFSSAISSLSKNKRELGRMSKSALKHARKSSWSAVASKYKTIFSGLVE